MYQWLRSAIEVACYLKRRRQWHPTPVLLPGKSHGRRSLVGCSPWGRKDLDMTERLHFHFSLSCIGEGNGNPLQCSCLENPRDGRAWWAAAYGVAQSRTRLKWLSSSSSSHFKRNEYSVGPLYKKGNKECHCCGHSTRFENLVLLTNYFLKNLILKMQFWCGYTIALGKTYLWISKMIWEKWSHYMTT